MFCFARLSNYRLPERARPATASALVLGSDRAYGYRGADDGVHMWAITGRQAVRTWRATKNGCGEIILFCGFLLNRDELLTGAKLKARTESYKSLYA